MPIKSSEELPKKEIETKPDVYTAIVLDELGRILVSVKPKNRDFPGQPALISGIGSSAKFGLSGIAAARGEVQADLGTTTFEGKEVFQLRLPSIDKAGKNIVYVGNVVQKDIRLNPKFSTGYDWYSLEEALKLDLAFDHKQVLEQYQKYLALNTTSENFYNSLHDGKEEGVTDKDFITKTANEITKLSASYLALELGLDESQIEFYLRYIGDQYLGQLNECYIGNNSLDKDKEATILAIVNNLPKQFDQAYLPELARVIGLGDLSISPNLPQITLFSTLIEYCRNKIPMIDQNLKLPGKEEVLSVVSSQLKSSDTRYVQAVTDELSKHFEEEGGRELIAGGQDYMKLSLHLANYIWQLAKLPQYCLEQNKYNAEFADHDSKRLVSWQYHSFPQMMENAYREYAKDPKLRSNPMDILIMVAFKIFQDLNEYQA